MRFILCIIALLCSSALCMGQEKRLVQFSGAIYNTDSNVVVPYVTITNRSYNDKTASANHLGYFSFVARPGDTVVFSAIGYRREALVIPLNLPGNSFTAIIKMKATVVNLPAVTVLPWASVDEFNRAFMALNIPDDDTEIARKNVSRESLVSMTKSLPRDGKEMQGVNFQNNHISLSNKAINQRAASPLLNPLAWGAFIQQLIKGDQSRNK